jgi:hypothetical protein
MPDRAGVNACNECRMSANREDHHHCTRECVPNPPPNPHPPPPSPRRGPHPPPMFTTLTAGWPAWSHDLSPGTLFVSAEMGDRTSVDSVRMIRNMGGGTSACCSDHPVAAPARVRGTALQLRLLPRGPPTSARVARRNGARVYFAETRGEDPRSHDDVHYARWPLLGKRFSFTIDLSGAECGCNAAVYLVSMADNRRPGTCGGDYYCDASSVCGHGSHGARSPWRRAPSAH